MLMVASSPVHLQGERRRRLTLRGDTGQEERPPPVRNLPPPRADKARTGATEGGPSGAIGGRAADASPARQCEGRVALFSLPGYTSPSRQSDRG
jgi:hypothetical protein